MWHYFTLLSAGRQFHNCQQMTQARLRIREYKIPSGANVTRSCVTMLLYSQDRAVNSRLLLAPHPPEQPTDATV